MEIERKFIVNHIPSYLQIEREDKIIQGYIAFDEKGVEVRVRNINKHFFLTVKGPGNLIRQEIEIEIDHNAFASLESLTFDRQIEKTRYITLYNHEKIEIDVYHKSLNGLITAEIEFDTFENSMNFNPPNWFGEEVTYNLNYKNKNLAFNQAIPSK